MKAFYSFKKKLYGGVWEIKSNIPYNYIRSDYLNMTSQKLLDLPFQIKHGKKQRDIIYYYGDISIEFLSQNIYDCLSKFCDVSSFLYPIHINEVNDIYYFIHDLPEFLYINRDKDDEIHCFLLQDKMPNFFTLENSRFKIITPEIKDALHKAKITNIEFKPMYGVSSMEEYYELQRLGCLCCNKN